MRPNIMFVDDSIPVLECLQWLFKEEPYYIFTFDNPHDALSVINTLEWAVVVAERYMRNMDGLEFLKKAREKSTHTLGVIMTGYDEINEAFDTLHPGCVYRYVKKPLDTIEIKEAVKEAIAQYEINAGSKGHEVYIGETHRKGLTR